MPPSTFLRQLRGLCGGRVTTTTPNPPGGDYGIRDGKLTGVISEAGAMIPFMKVLPALTPEVITKAVTGIAAMAAKAGVTYVHEAATGRWRVSKRSISCTTRSPSRAAVRGSMSLWGELAGLHRRGNRARLRRRPAAFPDRQVGLRRIQPGYTGYMRENYLGRDSGRGQFHPEQLADNFAKTVAAQWPIMCHANGDAALTW